MADTGYQEGSAAVGNRAISGGIYSWSNPTNAYSINSNDASITLGAGDTSLGLAVTAFGLSADIPSGATIDGFEVEFTKSGNTFAACDVVRLILADDSDGTDNKNASVDLTKSVTDVAGGASDLWGDTWSRADVIDVDFGAFMGASAAGSLAVINVDAIRIKVYYTPGITITDVNTTESWNDGDTGLVITGTGFTG